MYGFWSWSVSFLIIAALAFTVAWNIAHLVYGLKCFRVRECFKQNCRFKCWCDKYREDLDCGDLEMLHGLLEKFREETGT